MGCSSNMFNVAIISNYIGNQPEFTYLINWKQIIYSTSPISFPKLLCQSFIIGMKKTIGKLTLKLF